MLGPRYWFIKIKTCLIPGSSNGTRNSTLLSQNVKFPYGSWNGGLSIVPKPKSSLTHYRTLKGVLKLWENPCCISPQCTRPQSIIAISLRYCYFALNTMFPRLSNGITRLKIISWSEVLLLNGLINLIVTESLILSMKNFQLLNKKGLKTSHPLQPLLLKNSLKGNILKNL